MRRRTRTIGIVGAGLTLAACTAEPPVPAATTAVAYRCAGLGRVEALYQGRDRLRLFLPGQSARRLDAARAASGVRYAVGDLVFWSKGDRARLTRRGGVTVTCEATALAAPWAEAAATGARFRALGQEPGWIALVGRVRVTARLDYGSTVVTLPAAAPETQGGKTIWRIRTHAHALRLIARERPCRDAMSGARFPLTVRLTLDGHRYDGCGRWLVDPDPS